MELLKCSGTRRESCLLSRWMPPRLSRKYKFVLLVAIHFGKTRNLYCIFIIPLFLPVFDSELIEDLRGETSGYFCRMMYSLCTGFRQVEECDDDYAEEQAQKLVDVSLQSNLSE